MISSLTNPKIKEVVRLQSTQKRKKSSFFVVEGLKENELAQRNHYSIDRLFVCEQITGLFDSDLQKLKHKTPHYFNVSKEVYKKIAHRESTEGIVGIYSKKQWTTDQMLDTQQVLVLQNVDKPGNIGAILRSANAFGISNIFLTGHKQIDIYAPQTIRASLGAIFSSKIHYLEDQELILALQENAFNICVTSAKNSTSIQVFKWPEKCALVMGSEESGVSTLWTQKADALINIPMCGEVSSLNVSVAAGLAMYEMTRASFT